MKCPHCLNHIHSNSISRYIGKDQDGMWGISYEVCPSCKKIIINLIRGNWEDARTKNERLLSIYTANLVRPKAVNRQPIPKEVPNNIADDYKEACLVLADSPKASAALSRRCLQHILREKAGIKPGNLSDEIQQVLDSSKIPTYITDSLDAVRNTGNFAAHPIKSDSTGQIVDVEPGEAEWNLDVIESLFDFFYVQPEIIKKKRSALDDKLKDSGKPPMKK